MYILGKFEPCSFIPVGGTGVNEHASELNRKINTSAIVSRGKKEKLFVTTEGKKFEKVKAISAGVLFILF